MGNRTTRSSLRNAIVYLNISADPIQVNDDKFWNQIFSEEVSLAEYVIKNITVQEIRILRDGSSKNFATLAYKMVERLCLATGTLCNTTSQQTAVLNAIRILIRMIPCMFEDNSWRYFLNNNYIDLEDKNLNHLKLIYPEKNADERDYVAYLPQRAGSRSTTPTDGTMIGERVHIESSHNCELYITKQLLNTDLDDQVNSVSNRGGHGDSRSLMKAVVLSICDLLFCPEFTVLPHKSTYLSNAVDTPPEDLKSLSTHDYVWEPGVGFDSNINSTTYYDKNRSELLQALLVCFSSTLYETPEKCISSRNTWIELFVSDENRHALPMFTSLLNVIFGYKPARPLLQLNSFLFEASRERLVELSSQILIAVLDYQLADKDLDLCKNLFIDYLSRIHRNEDLLFLSKGFTRLLNQSLQQGYIWNSCKLVELDQELQILFWKACNLNKKFIQFLLNSNDIQDIVVPILYHMNENFREPSKTALIHMGVFNLLVLSSERNFGVRLNKRYAANVLDNLPEFSGSHVDLMIIVFHKLIMYGYKINQLYDYLLTILVNISPYLKSITLLGAKCLIQLFETFSSTLVVFTEPNYHQLVAFLLEIFNNIIQYQFDGNTNLVYVILTKKDMFVKLANLSTTQKSIDKIMRKLMKQKEKTMATDRDTSRDEKSCAIVGEGTINQSQVGSDDDLSSISATVSCISQQDPDFSSKRREVSLVATPDLSRITQPTYPFDNDGSNICSEQQKFPQAQCNKLAGNIKISLDDILNDTNECFVLTKGAESVFDKVDEREVGQNEPHDEVIDNFSRPVDPSTTGATIKLGSLTDPTRRTRRWKPTSEWLKEWKKTLPLQTILRMIAALDPQIEQMRQSNGRELEEAEIMKFLQNGTLVGLLPVPHPILIRKYNTNDSSTIWFRACAWGIIFVRSTIWTGTDIKLIKIL